MTERPDRFLVNRMEWNEPVPDDEHPSRITVLLDVCEEFHPIKLQVDKGEWEGTPDQAERLGRALMEAAMLWKTHPDRIQEEP